MKLTKKRRHEIYKATLKRVKKTGWETGGFCYHLRESTDLEDPNPYHHMELYPEIKKHEPEKANSDFSWFERFMGGDEKREKILRRAIRETAPKKRKSNQTKSKQ